MEPRPHERGNVESVEVAEEMAACFNGATSSRTWKPVSTGTGISGLTTLQWSHVLTNVETTTARPRSRPYRRASMEPRLHERGNAAITRDASAGMFLLQWSHVLTNVETGVEWLGQTCVSGLQWSHVLTNVETYLSPQLLDVSVSFNGATSSRTWKREGVARI